MASPYPRWDSLGSGPGFRSTATAWDLRWWILTAVMTSVVVHGALFVLLKRYRLPLADASAAVVDKRTGVFDTSIERVTIPENVLKDLAPEKPVVDPEKANAEPVKEVPDITQLAEAVKDRDVTLTPTIKDPAANLTLSKPAPGTAGDLLDNIKDIRAAMDMDLTKSLLSRSSALQPQAVKPDDEQVLIDPQAGTGNTGDLKRDVMSALKKGTGGDGGLDGFASLDDLVNYKGPITGDFKTMLRTDLLFDFASAKLRDDARLSLMKLGMIIQTNSGATFRLTGHTDTIGDDPSNQILSEARARAVKDWLVTSLHLDASRIIVEGMGERQPVVNPRGTKEEQAINRRVEIQKTGGAR